MLSGAWYEYNITFVKSDNLLRTQTRTAAYNWRAAFGTHAQEVVLTQFQMIKKPKIASESARLLGTGLPFLWAHYEVTDVCDKWGKYEVVSYYSNRSTIN
jgi:hypothetical protein